MKPKFEIDTTGRPYIDGEELFPLDLSFCGLSLTNGGYLECGGAVYVPTSELTQPQRAEIAKFVIAQWLDWALNGPK